MGGGGGGNLNSLKDQKSTDRGRGPCDLGYVGRMLRQASSKLQESIDTGDEDDLGNAADSDDEGVFFFVCLCALFAFFDFGSQHMRDGAARAQQHDGDGTRALPGECQQLDVIQLLRGLVDLSLIHI